MNKLLKGLGFNEILERSYFNSMFFMVEVEIVHILIFESLAKQVIKLELIGTNDWKVSLL